MLAGMRHRASATILSRHFSRRFPRRLPRRLGPVAVAAASLLLLLPAPRVAEA
jgi:hypothetical protein